MVVVGLVVAPGAALLGVHRAGIVGVLLYWGLMLSLTNRRRRRMDWIVSGLAMSSLPHIKVILVACTICCGISRTTTRNNKSKSCTHASTYHRHTAMTLGLTLGRRHHRTAATTTTTTTTTIATTTVTPAAAPVRLGVVGLAAGAELRHGELAAVVQTDVGWVRLLLWLG